MKYGMFTSYKEAGLYLLAGALASGVVLYIVVTVIKLIATLINE